MSTDATVHVEETLTRMQSVLEEYIDDRLDRQRAQDVVEKMEALNSEEFREFCYAFTQEVRRRSKDLEEDHDE